ncbi:hypothetical protein F5Y03DRAFT_369916 [Xylaria venustula]|nr:hypothetical protein F5Y03DRAFT_369916 [Xylaria venustula]
MREEAPRVTHFQGTYFDCREIKNMIHVCKEARREVLNGREPIVLNGAHVAPPNNLIFVDWDTDVFHFTELWRADCIDIHESLSLITNKMKTIALDIQSPFKGFGPSQPVWVACLESRIYSWPEYEQSNEVFASVERVFLMLDRPSFGRYGGTTGEMSWVSTSSARIPFMSANHECIMCSEGPRSEDSLVKEPMPVDQHGFHYVDTTAYPYDQWFPHRINFECRRPGGSCSLGHPSGNFSFSEWIDAAVLEAKNIRIPKVLGRRVECQMAMFTDGAHTCKGGTWWRSPPRNLK